MKRAIILAFMALTTVSCVIDDGMGNNSRTGYNLLDYSENILKKFVKIPVEDVAFMLTLDEFMQLDEEQQNSPEWAGFKGGIEHYSNTLLRIPSKGITVDTRGVSLRTPGKWWRITITDDYRHSTNSGYDYYWFDQFSTAPGHSGEMRLTCTSTDKYELIDEKVGKDIMQLSIEVVPSVYGGYDFSCMGSGRMAENENGLSSEYEVQEYYYKRYSFTEDGTENSSHIVLYQTEALVFRVDTYHKGEALDWCELNIENHGQMTYSGNLELNNRFYYE